MIPIWVRRFVLSFLLIAVALGVTPPALAEVSRAQEIRARVFKLLSDGVEAFKQGRSKDAISVLSQAADIALNSFRAYYYLGLALKADRQYQAAIEPLQVALELEPVNLQAHVALGDCYLMKGDPAEALAEYHRALALQGDYAPAYDGLGRAAEASGDIEKAIEHYREAIALNPGFPDSSLNLGDLYMRDGRLNEATELFLKAIKVRPDFAAAYNRLGVAYARQRLSNEAIAALRQAELLERGNPWHPVTIGGIFLELDHLVQAEREFEKALSLDPEYLEAYRSKAELLRRQGQLAESVGALEAGLRRDADDPALKAKMRERVEQITGESRRATELEQKAQSEPQDPAALAALADLKAELGDHASAASLYKRAVSLSPDDLPLLRRLGYSALRSELFEEASEAYRALSRSSPDDPDVQINLALALIGIGEIPGAEAALAEANRMRPGDPKPLVYLGNLYTLSGQRDKAIESLNASLALTAEGSEERSRVQRLLKTLQDGARGGS